MADTDRKLFLDVFRKEWKIFRRKGREAATIPGTRTEGKFDANAQVGEIRIFADTPQPLIGVLCADDDNWRVIPVSEFTVPATDREILVGKRVYQLWNAFTPKHDFVERSWLVATLPPEDVRDIGEALAHVENDTPLREDLVACMGLPIADADDERREYERTFADPLNRNVAAALPTRTYSFWRSRKAWSIAACFVMLLGLSVVVLRGPMEKKSRVYDNVRADVVQEIVEEEAEALVDVDARPPAPPKAEVVVAKPEEPKVVALKAEAKPQRKAERMRKLREEAKVVKFAPNGTLSPCYKCAPVAKCVPAAMPLCGSRGIESPACVIKAYGGYDGAAEPPPCLSASRRPESDAVGRERFAEFSENEFVEVTREPLSTFGLDVDTASYTTMRRYLNEMKRLPPKDSVRIEEYVNYFSYDYAEPKDGTPVAVNCELAACPWNASNKLLRVGVQAKRIAKDKLPTANLVFLIDVSGSMEWNGGFDMAKGALRMLTNELRAEDFVSIVTYANGTAVRLESTSGREKAKILGVVESLSSGGGTSGGAGLQLAYEQAAKNFRKGGNNRVILITDGDFNIGIQTGAELERFIADKRDSGVFLTVLGVGRGNYQDGMMKKLSNAGNGNYAFLDGVLEAKKVLMTEFGGTMCTVAKDVKLQLEFNPAQTAAYRLLGYESRRLAAKDFNDDKKDAGEMGAGHTMTALYELVPAGVTNAVAKTDPLKYQKTTPVASGELLTVKLRYKEPDGDKSKLVDTPVVAEQITRKKGPSADWRFASAVAEFALILEDSKFKGAASMANVIKRAKSAKGKDENGYRAEFIRLAETAELLKISSRREQLDDF